MWDAIRDIMIASINKGQFPMAMVGLIVIIALIRMPSEAVATLMTQFIEELVSLRIAGWSISVIITFSWYRHAKKLRRVYTKEVDRIAEEKNELQQKLTTRKNQSSKR